MLAQKELRITVENRIIILSLSLLQTLFYSYKWIFVNIKVIKKTLPSNN